MRRLLLCLAFLTLFSTLASTAQARRWGYGYYGYRPYYAARPYNGAYYSPYYGNRVYAPYRGYYRAPAYSYYGPGYYAAPGFRVGVGYW